MRHIIYHEEWLNHENIQQMIEGIKRMMEEEAKETRGEEGSVVVKLGKLPNLLCQLLRLEQ